MTLLTQPETWKWIGEFSGRVWAVAGTLVGVLVGAWLATWNQKRQWFLDNKRAEYRELLKTLADCGSKFAILSGHKRSFVEGSEIGTVGEAARNSAKALAELPDGTVVDGEVVALDESGRPNFNLLQNFRNEAQHIHYFIFDLLIFNERDLTGLPLSERRKLLKSLKLASGRMRIAEQFEAKAMDMLAAVRQQGLEGVIG